MLLPNPPWTLLKPTLLQMQLPIALCHNFRLKTNIGYSREPNSQPSEPYYERTCLVCAWPCFLESRSGSLVSWGNFPPNSSCCTPGTVFSARHILAHFSFNLCRPSHTPTIISWTLRHSFSLFLKQRVTEGRSGLKIDSPTLPWFVGLSLQPRKAEQVYALRRYRMPYSVLKLGLCQETGTLPPNLSP